MSIRNGYYYPDWIWHHKLNIDPLGNKSGDCAFLFIEGNRRAGKSTGVGIYALIDWFKYGYQTAIIRRYLKDFEDKKKPAMENFWLGAWNACLENGYIRGLEDHELKFESHYAYIDGRLFSYPVALNKFNDYKQVKFENVHTIIYDEFVTENGSKLNGEVFALYNVYDTIARNRENALDSTSVIFISNIITIANDFHIELGIDRELRRDTKRLLRPEKGYAVEMVNNTVAAEKLLESPIAKVMQAGETGRAYLGYSQGNEGKDNNAYIGKLSGANYYCHNLTYDGKVYAMKFYAKEGKYYFTDKDVDENYPLNYALTKEDHTWNTTLITSILKQKLKMYQRYYAAGLLYFNSQRTKNIFLELFMFL